MGRWILCKGGPYLWSTCRFDDISAARLAVGDDPLIGSWAKYEPSMPPFFMLMSRKLKLFCPRLWAPNSGFEGGRSRR